MMVILHVASISNSSLGGVSVAVPQHVLNQSKIAKVGFINVGKQKIKSIDDENSEIQMDYNDQFNISMLPQPFDKPDIVIFHECYRIDYIKISKNIRKKNIPYIIIPHGCLRNEAQKKKRLKKILGNIFVFNSFIKHAVGIQCLSKKEYEDTNFALDKRFISTNGVNLPNIKKEKFNSDKIKFIYIGRLEIHVKGLDLLIKAISKIKQTMIDNNCILEIYGPDYAGRYEKVETLIKENDVENIVKMHHEITGREKERELLNSDIFVQTSRHEGMPLGVLEALSYGIPCLVTEGTNLGQDIAKYSAGWCANTDIESIENSICEAIKSRKYWKEYGKNAIELVKQNYSWNKVAQETIENYKQMINK